MNKDIENFCINQFGLVPRNELASNDSGLEYLKDELAKRITFLINQDIDKLLQILYRIDVSQSDTDKAFNLGEVSKISSKLADHIIRRQIKKYEYSSKFKE